VQARKLILALIAWFWIIPAYATSVTVPYVLQPLTPIQSGPLNSNFSTIYNAFNGGITDVNIGTGASINLTKLASFSSIAQVRAYIVSGSPLADGTSAGSATFYVGPYNGNLVSCYDGVSNWTLCSIAEQTVSVAALANGVYDIVVANNGSGVATVGTPVAWSGNTPPSHTLVNGIVCESTTTNRVVAAVEVQSGVVKDWTGSRWISNLQNKIMKPLFCCDSTTSWTYASTTTRAANSNFTEGAQRVSVVWADASGAIVLTNSCGAAFGSVTNAVEFIGIGVNSTTAFTVNATVTQQGANANLASSATVSYASASNIGFNYFQRLEAVSTGTGTFYNNYGSNFNAQSMSGFTYN
jgi:hypothetical protein